MPLNFALAKWYFVIALEIFGAETESRNFAQL